MKLIKNEMPRWTRVFLPFFFLTHIYFFLTIGNAHIFNNFHELARRKVAENEIF